MDAVSEGYVLHQRPWSESSLILTLFTLDYGLFRALRRGARRPTRVRFNSYQTFSRAHIRWRGHGRDIAYLNACEVIDPAPVLSAECLFAAHYLNELLFRLLRPLDPNPALYSAYSKTLHELTKEQNLEISLRHFEFILLNALGYGPGWFEAGSGQPLNPLGHYRFELESGFIRDPAGLPAQDLLRISTLDFSTPTIRHTAKTLSRQIIHQLLPNYAVLSRFFFA